LSRIAERTIDRVIEPRGATGKPDVAKDWQARRRKNAEAKPAKKKWTRRRTISTGVTDANARLDLRGRGDLR
jgi:hypothetical protein